MTQAQTTRPPEPAAARGQTPEAASPIQLATDPRSAADDLIRALEGRRTALQAEAGRGGANAAEIPARIAAIEHDLAALRSGAARRDLAEVERIAQAHAIDPRHVRGALMVTGRSDVSGSHVAARGIGTTTTDVHEDTSVRDGDTAGAIQGNITTRQRTSALTTDGLEHSRSVENQTTHGDGGQTTFREASSHRLGSAQGGLGYQGSRSSGQTERRADGSGVATSQERTGGIGVTGTGVTAGGGQTRRAVVTRADGSSVDSSRGVNGSASVGLNESGGLASVTGRFGSTRARTENDADGQATRQTNAATNGSLGYVDGENGQGITGSFSRSGSQATREDASSHNVTGDVTVTNRQVGGNLGLNGSAGAGPIRTTGSFGAGGSYTITAEPIPLTSPQRYRVQTVQTYNVSLGHGFGSNRDRLATPAATEDPHTTASTGLRPNGALQETPSRSGSISIGVTGTTRRTRTYSHEMTLAEIERYTAAHSRAATTGQASGDAPPEIALAGRYHAAQAMGRPPTEAELQNPADALRMREGSSIEYAQENTGTVTGQAQGSIGAVGGGVSGSASNTTRVTRRVRRVRHEGALVVEVRLVFSETRERSASGHASVDGIGAQGSHARSDQDGRTVLVRLQPPPGNPRYAEQYSAALSVTTQTEAETLARETGAEMTISEQRSTTDSGGVGTIEDGAVSNGGTRSEQRSTGQEMTLGQRDAHGRRTLSGTTTGQAQSTLGVNLLGTNVLQQSEANAATNAVDEHGRQSVAITNTQRGGLQTPAWLQTMWRTTRQRIASWDLDENDLEALSARAGNDGGWLGALAGRELLHIRGPWLAFGAALRQPRPDPRWVEADPAIARRVALGAAVTSFIGSVGPTYGIAAMGAVLRGANPTHPLGVQWQWPDELRAQQASWVSLHAEVRGADDRFRDVEGDPARRRTSIQAELTRIVTGLRAIVSAVDACQTFENPSVKPEMTAAVERDIRAIQRSAQTASNAAVADAGPNASTNVAAEGAEASASGPMAAPPGPEREAQRANAEARADLTGHTATLRRFKGVERQHWVAAQSHIGRAGDLFSNTNREVNAALGELDQIELDWLGPWGAAWRAALTLHRRLGTEREAPRDLRTNWRWRAELLRQAMAQVGPTARMAFDPGPRLQRWEQQDHE